MHINITNISINFYEGVVETVSISFHGYYGQDKLLTTGTLNLTGKEYEGNESPIKLKEIIKEYMSKEENVTEEEPEATK